MRDIPAFVLMKEIEQVISMKQRCLALLAILLLLGLAGCGKQTSANTAASNAGAAPTETTETVPETTVPPDGDPNSVTCKGSYTAPAADTAVVATVGNKQLTNDTLQAYYELEVASYLASNPEQVPDMTQGLDTQACPIDSAVNSWQQYFLKQALHRWQTVQALICNAEAEEMPIDAAFAPDEELHAECMVNIPAIKFLYGENRYYTPNTMHQAYLDSLSDSLQGTMLQAATDYNYAYMYLTTMGYYLEPTEEETEAAPSGESYVDLRHILLLPEDTSSEQSWTNCYRDAERKLNSWKASFRRCEGSFAEIAYAESKEEATYKEGGFYYQVHQGQLTSELDAWCFDPERQAGDTTIIRDGSGIHILYISRVYSQGQVQAEQSAKEQKLRDFVQKCLDENPIRITYSGIALTAETTALTYDGVLYKDIAHERYPEIPIYLQQDFGNTMYGNYKLRSHGCGITSLAMLSTYMTDTELTPPTLCARYGRYCHSNGTDAMIFKYEPPVLGFFLKKQTYQPNEAKQALEDGYVVVSSQIKGYWTRGGHYIVLESIDEDGVQVRDTNIYNYEPLPAHHHDRHAWSDIIPKSTSYWIYEKKQTTSPLCTRCGDPSQAGETVYSGDYLCQRCEEALLRRNSFLAL